MSTRAIDIHAIAARLRYEYLSGYEYSTDRREWKPCQVTEL